MTVHSTIQVCMNICDNTLLPSARVVITDEYNARGFVFMFTPKFPAMHDTRNENELKHFVIIIVFICKSLAASFSKIHSNGLIKNKQQRIYDDVLDWARRHEVEAAAQR